MMEIDYEKDKKLVDFIVNADIKMLKCELTLNFFAKLKVLKQLRKALSEKTEFSFDLRDYIHNNFKMSYNKSEKFMKKFEELLEK